MTHWRRFGGSRANSRSAPAATRPRLRWTPRARRPNGSSPTRGPQETTRAAVGALAVLAAADAEATSIRAAGEAEADALLRRVAAERDELVAEFTAAVLPREA